MAKNTETATQVRRGLPLRVGLVAATLVFVAVRTDGSGGTRAVQIGQGQREGTSTSGSDATSSSVPESAAAADVTFSASSSTGSSTADPSSESTPSSSQVRR